MIIRKGHHEDLAKLKQLFVETVSNVCTSDYDNNQIEVWKSSIENSQRWEDLIENQFILVAVKNGEITGFCTLDNGNCIDMLYVHKDYQRQGIARKLYAEIEKEAKQQGQKVLFSDVSKTARPFFESVGFKVIKEQTVKIKGVDLTNYRMIKKME